MLLDAVSGMFYGDETSKLWLIDNEAKWDLFLHRYKYADRIEIKEGMFNSSPTLGMRAIKDFLIPDDKKIKIVQKMVAETFGEVWMIAGKKHGGKTGTAYWLLELAHAMGRECCIAGPPQKIPPWCNRVMDPAAAPDNSVVYVTEAGMQYSARSSMRAGQRDALSILPVIRHSGRLVIAETQHTRIIDVNFLRMMDCMILKPEPMYHFDERRNPMARVMEVLKPQNPRETLFFTGAWFTLIRNQPLPKCWSDELSMPYKPIHKDGEALAFALDLLNQDYPLTEVRRILIARSFNRPLFWWIERIEGGDGGGSGVEEIKDVNRVNIAAPLIPEPKDSAPSFPNVNSVNKFKPIKPKEEKTLECVAGKW